MMANTELSKNELLEQAVSMPLSIPEQANEQLLSLLYRMAIEGDLRAAKLYLDYSPRMNPEKNNGLSLADAIALLSEKRDDDTV
jgi:hypothetical protein